MKKSLRPFLLLPALAALGATGCAAAFRNPEVVRVETVPPGATVRVNNRDVGHTPLDLTVERSNDNKSLAVVLEGYETRSTPITNTVNTRWLIWDAASCIIPITLCIPVVADAVSGAWNDIDKGPYRFELQKLPVATTPVPAPALPAPVSASPGPQPTAAPVSASPALEPAPAPASGTP